MDRSLLIFKVESGLDLSIEEFSELFGYRLPQAHEVNPVIEDIFLQDCGLIGFPSENYILDRLAEEIEINKTVEYSAMKILLTPILGWAKLIASEELEKISDPMRRSVFLRLLEDFLKELKHEMNQWFEFKDILSLLEIDRYLQFLEPKISTVDCHGFLSGSEALRRIEFKPPNLFVSLSKLYVSIDFTELMNSHLKIGISPGRALLLKIEAAELGLETLGMETIMTLLYDGE